MKNNIEKIYISTNLKYLRNLKEKSLKDIASVCNKTDVAVHYWEAGSREPSAVDIAKLSNYFNISVDDLLLKDLRIKNNYTKPDELDILYTKARKLLSDEEIKTIKLTMQRAIDRSNN